MLGELGYTMFEVKWPKAMNDVLMLVNPRARMILVNVNAREDAKIIKLMFD